eukprot:jgi/Ulvmu1/6082/UM027_0060.1
MGTAIDFKLGTPVATQHGGINAHVGVRCDAVPLPDKMLWRFAAANVRWPIECMWAAQDRLNPLPRHAAPPRAPVYMSTKSMARRSPQRELATTSRQRSAYAVPPQASWRSASRPAWTLLPVCGHHRPACCETSEAIA